MKLTESTEVALVFLIPLFAATIYNNFQKKKVRANMKVVYYKFFVFCAILFLASQISIQIGNNAAIEPVIRVFGEILMALLVFDFFLIPNSDTHPDDIAIIHTSILWFLGFIFLFLCSMNHFMNVADENKGWNMHPIFEIHKISKKVYSECAMPSPDSQNLPICNLFSYVQKQQNDWPTQQIGNNVAV